MAKSPGGWRSNLILLAITLLLCLVGGEAALRLIGFKPAPTSSDLFVPDDTLGWVGRANHQAILEESGIKFNVQMNRWGFRDDQPPDFSQVESKQRIMFLGDSFIMGSGLAQSARVSDRIEQTDPGRVAYNFGLLGYSTDQELLVLKKYGPEIRPQVVLLFVCANDLIYNDSDFGHRKPKPHFRLQADGTLALG